MPKAIQFHEIGGPEVMRFEEVAVGEPGPGQVRLRQTAIGVNYIDTYHRSGLYKLPLPSGLGMEGAGVVEAVGPGVTHVKAGERAAYMGGPPGAYAEVRLVPADRVLRLPEDVSDRQAAGVMLKGLTVWALVRRVHAVKPGETVLFHAAAGGVGLIACQWLESLGATVIGTAGTDEKAALAKARGCDHAIVYTRENFTQRTRELTGGAGVPVVYDSVGKATFEGSLDCLQPLGLMVSFGNASGAVPPFDIGTLAVKGSLFLTRPTVMTYTAKRSDLEAGAAELFQMIRSRKIEVDVRATYALKDAAQCHRDLQARRTAGSILLVP